MAGYGEYEAPPPPPDPNAQLDNAEQQHERSSYDSYRDRERSHGKYSQRDRDHGHKQDRDRGRGKSERNDRIQGREYHRSGSRSREQERRNHDKSSDYERERRHKHRTRSSSRGRSRDRSRSRSQSRDRRSKRSSGFDMAPPGATGLPGATLPGQLPGVSQQMPAVLPGMFGFHGTQFGGLSTIPMQAMTQQATRHARRVYVGGLPPLANEQTIATFFSQAMAAIGGNTAGPGDAVINVYINHEKKFAFVEMRTVEEASNAMALDGILFEGLSVRVRRPSDYNPSLAATLGPSQPSPHLHLVAVGLTPGLSGGADGPDKIFVGGLPYYLTEAQTKELLESFGPLRGFDLVKDKDTGNSKGYAFCVYQDPSATDVACAALNGMKMGDKTLTVRRAAISGQARPDQENVLVQAQQQIAYQKLALQASGVSAMGFGGLPGLMSGLSAGLLAGIDNGLAADFEEATKVVCLAQLVSVDELKDDEEFEDIYDDIKEECSKYGKVSNLVIPRPKPTGEEADGVGKAFVEYSDVQGSAKARASLNGRKFGGNTVTAVYYPEDKFSRGEFDG